MRKGELSLCAAAFSQKGETMKMRLVLLFGLLPALLVSCMSAPTPMLTETPAPTATLMPTSTPIPGWTPALATPLPTQPPITFAITPDAVQVTRWQEYEKELARCVLGLGGCTDLDFLRYALCEWDILGQSGQEVYVWAECLDSNNIMGRRPLVIYLERDGSIQKVEFGGYKGSYSNLDLFPANVQANIALYFQANNNIGPLTGKIHMLEEHLAWRLRPEHRSEPPLIILSADTPTMSYSTQSAKPILTPDAIQVTHWKQYQAALGSCVLNDCTLVYYENVLCEWDILGRSDQEVYVWAICSNLAHFATRKPAIIHLNMNGSVQKVETPSYNSWDSDIQRMFPGDVQAKIAAYFDFSTFHAGRAYELEIHLRNRFAHPPDNLPFYERVTDPDELPLIVLSTTPRP